MYEIEEAKEILNETDFFRRAFLEVSTLQSNIQVARIVLTSVRPRACNRSKRVFSHAHTSHACWWTPAARARRVKPIDFCLEPVKYLRPSLRLESFKLALEGLTLFVRVSHRFSLVY